MDYIVTIEDRTKALEAIDWCRANVDFFDYSVRFEKFELEQPVVFFFKNDTDATLFKMLWL